MGIVIQFFFFHISTVVRCRKNTIDAIREENGLWIVNISDIRDLVVDNFK